MVSSQTKSPISSNANRGAEDDLEDAGDARRRSASAANACDHERSNENTAEITNAHTGCRRPVLVVNIARLWPVAAWEQSGTPDPRRATRKTPAVGRHSREWRPRLAAAHPAQSRTITQPPPPAPQTLAARAPCCRCHRNQLVDEGSGDAGRIGAPQLPLFAHAGALTSSHCASASARDAWPAQSARFPQSCWMTRLSPLMCCLKTSQLLMPECRGAPV